MAQNWYLGGNGDGSSSPFPIALTFRGGWDSSTTANDRILTPYKIGITQNLSRAEASASPTKVCVARGVSPRLAAQTIDGTLDMVLSLLESNAAADFYTKIYAYVTQGDTDFVRGVLLDYTESSGTGDTEWPTTATGRALTSAQTLSSVVVLEGDHLVIEFGYSAENSDGTSRSGTIRAGSRNANYGPLTDLTVGATPTTSRAGFFVFSDTITFSPTTPTNLSPETAIDMDPLPYTSGSFSPESATFALWWKRTGDGSEDGRIGVFGGVSGVGTYTPLTTVRIAVGSDFPLYIGGYNGVFQALNIQLATSETVYVEVTSTNLTQPPGRDLVVTAVAGPGTPVTLDGDYLITQDGNTLTNPQPAVLIDHVTGVINGFFPTVVSENGTVADNGVFVLTNKSAVSGIVNQPIIYSPAAVQIAAVVGATITIGAGGQALCPVATDGLDFYVAQRQNALGPAIKLTKFDQLGTILQTWTIPRPTGWTNVGTIAVDLTGSTLYYTESLNNREIKRWDLGSNTALGDFVGADAAHRYNDIHVLGDGTVLFSSTALQYGQVYRYSAAGALLNTYAFTDPFFASTNSWFIDHIAPTNLDPVSFAVWFQQTSTVGNPFRDYVFTGVLTSSGVLVDTLVQGTVLDDEDGLLPPDVDVDAPDIYFGAPNSCPLLIMGVRPNRAGGGGTATLTIIKSTVPDGSGQLFDFVTTGGLDPATFQLSDGQSQVYSDLSPGTYGVEETPVPDGWTLTNIIVSNGDPPDAIVLSGGDNVTVTFVNTFTGSDCPGNRGAAPVGA